MNVVYSKQDYIISGCEPILLLRFYTERDMHQESNGNYLVLRTECVIVFFATLSKEYSRKAMYICWSLQTKKVKLCFVKRIPKTSHLTSSPNRFVWEDTQAALAFFDFYTRLYLTFFYIISKHFIGTP